VVAVVVAWALGVGVGARGALGSGRPSAWPVCIARTTAVHTGISELGRSVRGRLVTYTLRSRAMGNVQHVNVLLPAHFDPSGRTRYPVLLLLHGALGNYAVWDSQFLAIVGTLPVIAVMPSGSQIVAGGTLMDGDYSDWFGLPTGSAGVAPAWESYHIDERLPFIDRTLPTVPTAAGRAVMGISMGGGGAFKYAAEYPGTFGYAGSLSGELDPELPVAQAFLPKTCVHGDPAVDEVIWRDNDSANLAGSLRGVRLFVRSGDGVPGPFDATQPPADPFQRAVRQTDLVVEAGAHAEALRFLAAARGAGVPVDAAFYHGSHYLPYWHREMRTFVAWLRVQLRRGFLTRHAFSVESAHAAVTAWGWRFAVRRRVREFLYVRVGGGRLVLTGSGRVFVHSPAGCRLGALTGGVSSSVDLGPSHRAEQTQFGTGATRG
jgi:diacylglycerol O-acyltransferase / trehalose O-mycolyltransferase